MVTAVVAESMTVAAAATVTTATTESATIAPTDTYLYLYNTNSVCVCVCVCVSVKYRRPNGWTDHDQIWHAYADRSENGSYLKKLTPRQPRGHFGGFIGVKKVTNLGKIPNHWTDRDQIWHTYADSSRNGCRLKKVTP